MKEYIVRQTVSIVILASFPQDRYNFNWLVKNNLLSDEEMLEALKSLKIANGETSFELLRMQFRIEEHRLLIEGAVEKGERISELASHILSLRLPDKIKAIGLNGLLVLKIPNELYEIIEPQLFPTNYFTKNIENAHVVRVSTSNFFIENKEYIPILNLNVQLLKKDKTMCDLLFEYNNHLNIKEGNEEVGVDYVLNVDKYREDIVNFLSPLFQLSL